MSCVLTDVAPLSIWSLASWMATIARLSDLAVLARIALHIWVANFSFCSLCSCYYHNSKAKELLHFPATLQHSMVTIISRGHPILSILPFLLPMFPTKHVSVDVDISSNILSSCKTPNWKLKLFSCKSSPEVYHKDFSPVWSDRRNIRRGKSAGAAAVPDPNLLHTAACCSAAV